MGDPVMSTSVVHVIGRLDIGGAETMLLAHCRATPRDRLSTTVVCLSGKSGLLTPEFELCGVREVLCGIDPVATFPYRFLRFLRHERPDVVVSHISLASGFVLLVAMMARVSRRVAVFHSDGDGKPAGFRRRVYRRLTAMFLQFAATDIVGVTASTMRFSGVHGTRRLAMDVIPNAVDMVHFSPLERAAARQALGLPASGIVLAHVGRAAAEKNRKILPHVLSAMPPTTILVLAGSPATDDLDLDPQDPLASRIYNLGLLRDVRPLISAADVVILPSIREGLPVVILEALSCGRAVVATDLPGVRSIATDLPDIHLVPAGASPDKFADVAIRAIALARTEDEIRASVGVSGMDFQKTLEAWMKLCLPRP